MKTYPIELREILLKAGRGDVSVLPQLKAAFDEHPELAAQLGDLVWHAEQSILSAGFGDSLVVKEAATRKMAVLRSELMATVSTPLEKLLVDRIVLTWLAVHVDEMMLADRLKAGVSDAAQLRIGRSQARHLAAVKALAVLQKLVKPPLSPVTVASRLGAKRRPASSRIAQPLEPVPTHN